MTNQFRKSALAILLIISFCQLKANGISFVHTAHPSNISEYYTQIQHPLIDANPDAIIVVSNICSTCKNTNPPLGVYFDGSNWFVFRQDFQAIHPKQKFSISIQAHPDERGFIHTIQNSRIAKHISVIDHPLLNKQPDATFFTTAKKDELGIFNTSNIAIFYSQVLSRWCLVNDARKSFPNRLKVNIIIPKSNAATIPIAPIDYNGRGGYVIRKQLQKSNRIKTVIQTQSVLTNYTNYAFFGIRKNEYLPALCTTLCSNLSDTVYINVWLSFFDESED